MPLDIDTFKTNLQNILDKRNAIVLSDLPDEDKEKALAVFDKENDELNQSLDIYERLEGLDGLTLDLSPYAKVEQLPDLSPYALKDAIPVLYKSYFFEDMPSFLSTINNIYHKKIRLNSDFHVSSNIEVFGSLKIVSSTNRLVTCDYYESSGKNYYRRLYSSFSHGSFYFYDVDIVLPNLPSAGSSIYGFLMATYFPCVYVFERCNIKLSNGTLIGGFFSFSAPVTIQMSNVTISRSDINGFLCSTFRRKVYLRLRNVTLLDGLKIEDLFTDFSNVEII